MYARRGRLVRRLEDADAGVDRPERRAGEDQRPVVEHALQALDVLAPHALLLLGHRLGEVLTRGVDEVDPSLAHSVSTTQPRSTSPDGGS